MRAFWSIVTILSLLAPLALAEDEVRFFDGYKHGWRTNFHLFDTSKNGDAIYVGKKKGNSNYWKYFNISSNLEIDKYDSGLYSSPAYVYGAINFLHDRMFYGLLSGKGFGIIFNFEGKSDERLVLIRGERKKYSSTLGVEDSEEGVHSYFNYKNIVRLLINGDLFVAGELEPYVFVLPHEKLNKAIVRNNFFYAPMRYVTAVWRKTTSCPSLPFKDEVSLVDLDKCLEAIFKSHPKGEFNVDFPDTPDYDAF